MSRLTKAQKKAIQTALYDVKRAQAYIMKSDTHVVRESRITSFPKSMWTNGEGTQGIAITKDIGSDLYGLISAIRTLEQLLVEEVEAL